jgi:NADPH-dependent methylglyoxal reductase
MDGSPQQLVLLTGASGFLGGHVLDQLLAKGYSVRNVVRSMSNIEKIKREHEKYSKRLSFVTVADMTARHAFDEAVKGVSGIIHCASPFVLEASDYEQELLQPAINGTLSVLRAAAAQNDSPSIRVVLTSSFAAICDLDKGARPGYTYTARDWNPATYDEAAKHPSGSWAYCASKALAEKAAWEFMETASPKPGISLTTICPPWIIGPSVGAISTTKLNESTQMIYNLINGSLTAVPPTDFAGFCDVRDVAAALVKALETPASAGERFVLAAGPWRTQTAVDTIYEEFPELAATGKVPRGIPGAGSKEDFYEIDSNKALDALALKPRSLRVSVRDCVQQLLEADKEKQQ